MKNNLIFNQIINLFSLYFLDKKIIKKEGGK
jgi:hypothetical protein